MRDLARRDAQYETEQKTRVKFPSRFRGFLVKSHAAENRLLSRKGAAESRHFGTGNVPNVAVRYSK